MRETDDSDVRLDLERAAARLTDKQRRALWLWCQGYTQAEMRRRVGLVVGVCGGCSTTGCGSRPRR